MSMQNMNVTTKKTFDISAAALHILAMTLMLMDRLWATLLPAQEWLTCAGRRAFPIFAFMAVEGYFYTHSFQKYALRMLVFVLVALAGMALGTLGMVDYYGAGVLTVLIFYIFRGRKWWCLLGQLLALYWVNVELLGGLMYPVRLLGMEFELCQQGLALLALIPIWLYRGRQGHHSKPFQYACYAFYPVHMLVLAIVLRCVNR